MGFASIGKPKFSNADNGTGNNLICENNKGAPYCSKGGKLIISATSLKDFAKMFAGELINPLKREYILSSIYMPSASDIYKFPKIQGEELYVKFG
jgi:hypothetical protein